MLFVWGTYSLVHAPDGDVETCEFCGQDAVDRRTVERVSHFLWAPLFPRAFKSVSRCSHCKQVREGREPKQRRLVRLMGGRVAVSWSILALAIVAGIVGHFWTARVVRDRAAAPEVGDVWTIRAGEFPGTMADGELIYGRVQVDRVADGTLGISGCRQLSNLTRTIEKACTSYPIEMPDLPQASVSELVDRGAIDTIWRGGRDPMDLFYGVIGFSMLALIGHGLFARRFVKRAAVAGPQVPTAKVV
jgi:hypothetical protein